MYNRFMNKKNVDVLVIGSGPAGLLTSILAQEERKVTLIEKPAKEFKLAKRILVSGNGRANFFNQDLLDGRIKPDYLPFIMDESHIYAKDFIAYLEQEGFSYVKDEKLFYPYFRRSECLHSFLMGKCKKVDILQAKAIEVYPERNEILVLEEENKVIYHYQDLVLAIGGRSFDRNDYDYRLLDSLKVRYLPYQSMLCPVRTTEKIPAYLNKNRLKGLLSVYSGERKIYEEEGEILFKEDGLSGIAVFNSTVSILNELRKNKNATIRFELDYTSLEGFKKNTSLSCYPSFLLKYLKEKKIKPATPLEFHFKEMYSFKESQASYGGILLDEVDMKTLSLIKYPHIYTLGEMLNVNLICGGYNMGISFIQGYRVGKHLGESYGI